MERPLITDEWSYSLLLGYWLGDGHIVQMPRTSALRITLDARYPEIIEEARVVVRG